MCLFLFVIYLSILVSSNWCRSTRLILNILVRCFSSYIFSGWCWRWWSIRRLFIVVLWWTWICCGSIRCFNYLVIFTSILCRRWSCFISINYNFHSIRSWFRHIIILYSCLRIIFYVIFFRTWQIRITWSSWNTCFVTLILWLWIITICILIGSILIVFLLFCLSSCSIIFLFLLRGCCFFFFLFLLSGRFFFFLCFCSNSIRLCFLIGYLFLF